MQARRYVLVGALLALVSAVPSVSAAQLSLAPPTPSGQMANPVFEGWYKNADGTYSLSFGYFDRTSASFLLK